MTTMPQPVGMLRTTMEGNAVILRPMQADDAHLLFAMHQRVSPESIYARYLRYRRPTLTEITTLCRLVSARGAGFVATQQSPAAADPATIVGMAYYVREAHTRPLTAEPGILVEDRSPHQGVGRCLWQLMQRHAQMVGVRRLRVWAHPQNQWLTQLVRSGGLPYQAKAYADLCEYLVDLGEPRRYRIDRHNSRFCCQGAS